MVTWVMGGRAAGLILISTSTININTLSEMMKIRMDGLLRPISTSYIIASYITPITTTTTIYYHLITMNMFVNRTRRILENQ